MRPKILLFGNAKDRGRENNDFLASMRPKILLFGNRSVRVFSLNGRVASMRPKILLFGNWSRHWASRNTMRSFNEAEDFTLRKCEALPSGRLEHRRSFNEAEDFTLRKSIISGHRRLRAAQASMRPKILLFGNRLPRDTPENVNTMLQ